MSRSRPEKRRVFLQEVEQIMGDSSNLNLFSYVTLAGARVAMLGEKERPEKKRVFLEKVCRMSSGGLHHVEAYTKEIQEALLANGFQVKVCRIVSAARGLVGTGEAFGKALFEVGLAFDPLLNVPLIPASSLKGAFRHALRRRFGESAAERVFGGVQGGMGLLGVTDAYPVRARGRLLEPDILAPHYPETKQLETELDVEPNPVPFPTIAPGVEFVFYIYFNKGLPAALDERRRLRVTRELAGKGAGFEIFEGDLAEALQNVGGKLPPDLIPLVDCAVIYALTQGVGAKTSVGYTRFKLLEYRSVT
ncbi:MAG: type III-B CRISPR module RAMP protein Cmr6 [Thermofilaceae archaeon]